MTGNKVQTARSDSQDLVVCVFARAPVPGHCKTRLTPAYGAVGAARIAQTLARQTLKTVTRLFDCPIQLWCAPDSRQVFFSRMRSEFNVELHAQTGTDLGRRMSRTFATNLRRFERMILLGTDCPQLDADVLSAAVQQLEHDDAVLVPAHDGGYVLIGLRRPVSRLFCNVAWGTGAVLKTTLQRLRTNGMSYSLLPALYDIDTAIDVRRWRQCRNS